MAKEKRLGRGLAALLGSVPPEGEELAPRTTPPPKTNASAPPLKVFQAAEELQPPSVEEADTPKDSVSKDKHSPADGSQAQLIQIAVSQIDENPFQPRREFTASEIDSLSESLKQHDMLQPILVRRAGDRFELISGERRLRAARLSGWAKVPAQIKTADDRLVAELAIVENLQRKDLNPIEKALSFRRYLDEHACTQEELAQRLKIDRSTIANLMRLLELPQVVCDAVRDGKISAGHARALLPLGDEAVQIAFAERIRSEGWSVRTAEREVQDRIRAEDADPSPTNSVTKPRTNQQVAFLEQELRTALGTKVDIRATAKGKGRIVVHFKNHDEFDRLRTTLLGEDEEPRRKVG